MNKKWFVIIGLILCLGFVFAEPFDLIGVDENVSIDVKEPVDFVKSLNEIVNYDGKDYSFLDAREEYGEYVCISIKELPNQKPCVKGILVKNDRGSYDLDYNVDEFKERIDGILEADCINRGECKLPAEPVVISLEDKIKNLELENKALNDRLNGLDILYQTLNGFVQALQDWACSIDNKLAWCKI